MNYDIKFIAASGSPVKKQYIYPYNLKSTAKLWFWGLRDIVIIGAAAIVSVISLVIIGFIVPLALTAVYAFLTIRIDETSILDYIRRAWRYFRRTQYFEWERKSK